MSEEEQVRGIWKVNIPKAALHYPHLMHLILGMSALHFLWSGTGIHGKEVYKSAAIRHYDTAVRLLQPLVADISTENCHSVLAGAGFLSLYASTFAALQEPDHQAFDAIEELLSLAELARGVATITERAKAPLTTGRIIIALSPKPWDDAQVPPDFAVALSRLRTLAGEAASTEDTRGTCLTAITVLGENIKAEVVNPKHSPMTFMFLALTDRAFIGLLRSHDPVALVILAYYLVVLHSQRSQWWLGERGCWILREVEGSLKG